MAQVVSSGNDTPAQVAKAAAARAAATKAAAAKAAAAKAAATKAAATKAAAAKASAAKSSAARNSATKGGATKVSTTRATSAAKTGTSAAKKSTALSYDQTPAAKAANYGWSLAVINSDPELKALFAQATSTGPNGGWTVDHFVAKVRDTKWFKTHSDTARQAQVLQKADPSTYNARVAQSVAAATTMAGTMGAHMTTAQAAQIGTDTVTFGWNSDQLRQHMEKFVTAGTGDQYTGGAAQYQFQYTQMAGQYGVTVSPTIMGQWVRNSVSGRGSVDEVRDHMVALASSRYPALADRIKAGETLQDIADPYMQSYAKVLEVNPNTISLNDKLVQGALSGLDAKGQPAAKSVWQFEQDLRNDPRYMKTTQARDKAYSMAHQVLQDWGVKS